MARVKDKRCGGSGGRSGGHRHPERRAAIAKKAARMMSVEEVEAADTARRVRHQHCARVSSLPKRLPCHARVLTGCIWVASGVRVADREAGWTSTSRADRKAERAHRRRRRLCRFWRGRLRRRRRLCRLARSAASWLPLSRAALDRCVGVHLNGATFSHAARAVRLMPGKSVRKWLRRVRVGVRAEHVNS